MLNHSNKILKTQLSSVSIFWSKTEKQKRTTCLLSLNDKRENVLDKDKSSLLNNEAYRENGVNWKSSHKNHSTQNNKNISKYKKIINILAFFEG